MKFIVGDINAWNLLISNTLSSYSVQIFSIILIGALMKSKNFFKKFFCVSSLIVITSTVSLYAFEKYKEYNMNETYKNSIKTGATIDKICVASK
ncbi:hypothetical protein COBT_000606 [Conglomerata obtusa]